MLGRTRMTEIRTGFSEAPAGSTGTSQGKFRATAAQLQRESQFTMVASASFNSRFPGRVFRRPVKKSFAAGGRERSPEGPPIPARTQRWHGEAETCEPRLCCKAAHCYGIVFQEPLACAGAGQDPFEQRTIRQSESRHFFCEFLCGLGVSVVFEDTFSQIS